MPGQQTVEMKFQNFMRLSAPKVKQDTLQWETMRIVWFSAWLEMFSTMRAMTPQDDSNEAIDDASNKLELLHQEVRRTILTEIKRLTREQAI